MAEIITKTIENKSEWETFLSSCDEANFLHSWYWGQFYENLGQKIERTGFYKNKKLEGVLLSIVEDAKRGKHLIVPGGPIIDWSSDETVKTFTRQLRKIAILNNCSFIRVRPQLIDSQFSRNLFRKLGFTKAPMHLHAEETSQLDITKDDDELLKNMRKTTRYEIKSAINQNIRIIKSVEEGDIRQFYKLQLETAKRQKFIPFE